MFTFTFWKTCSLFLNETPHLKIILNTFTKQIIHKFHQWNKIESIKAFRDPIIWILWIFSQRNYPPRKIKNIFNKQSHLEDTPAKNDILLDRKFTRWFRTLALSKSIKRVIKFRNHHMVAGSGHNSDQNHRLNKFKYNKLELKSIHLKVTAAILFALSF